MKFTASSSLCLILAFQVQASLFSRLCPQSMTSAFSCLSGSTSDASYPVDDDHEKLLDLFDDKVISTETEELLNQEPMNNEKVSLLRHKKHILNQPLPSLEDKIFEYQGDGSNRPPLRNANQRDEPQLDQRSFREMMGKRMGEEEFIKTFGIDAYNNTEFWYYRHSPDYPMIVMANDSSNNQNDVTSLKEVHRESSPNAALCDFVSSQYVTINNNLNNGNAAVVVEEMNQQILSNTAVITETNDMESNVSNDVIDLTLEIEELPSVAVGEHSDDDDSVALFGSLSNSLTSSQVVPATPEPPVDLSDDEPVPESPAHNGNNPLVDLSPIFDSVVPSLQLPEDVALPSPSLPIVPAHVASNYRVSQNSPTVVTGVEPIPIVVVSVKVSTTPFPAPIKLATFPPSKRVTTETSSPKNTATQYERSSSRNRRKLTQSSHTFHAKFGRKRPRVTNFEKFMKRLRTLLGLEA